MKIVLLVIAGLAAISALAWLGLQVQPQPFPPHGETDAGAENHTAARGAAGPGGAVLPDGLRRAGAGHRDGRHQGRAKMTIGITMPARFVFIHNAGKDYRHYFEATWFGLPIAKVNERYIDGASLFELPFATYDNDASTNQGANLAIWAEAAWFPAIWLTDCRVRWQAVDEHTASCSCRSRTRRRTSSCASTPTQACWTAWKRCAIGMPAIRQRKTCGSPAACPARPSRRRR